MKNLMLFVFLFGVSIGGFAQKDDTNKELLKTTEKILDAVKQQSDSARVASIRVTASEIGLDVFELAIFRFIDISYEYVKNSEFGFGVAARICPDEKFNIGTREKFSITPFARYYFFSKKDYGSKGFYAETFLKCFGGKHWYDNYSSSGEEKYFDAAFGVGLGYKYVSRSGFVIDLNAGMGRSLGLSDIDDVVSVVSRGGITFGYRF